MNPQPTAPREHANHTGRILFSMCLSLMLVIATMSSLNLSLPELSLDLKASVTDLTWISDAYTLALAATVLPLGAVGDKFGRRSVLLIGLGIFGIAAAAAAMQTTPGGVIACRAVMGLGAAMIMPGTLATITATFPPERRARGVAVWTGVAGAGAIFGILMAGLLLKVWAWQSVFWTSATIAVVAILAAWAFAPNTRDEDQVALDLPGSIVSASMIGALVFGIISGGEHGWTSTRALGSFAASAVALLLFILIELRTQKPMLDVRIFRHRWFSVGSLALTAQFLGWLGYIFLAVQYLQLVLGYSAFKASWAALPVALVVIPMSQLAPRLVERLNTRTVVVAGLLVLAIGALIQSRMTVSSGYWHFLGGTLVMGCGLAWTSAPATAAVTAALPRAKQGVASAMNDTTREVGSSLGIAIIGTIFGRSYRDAIAPSLVGLPSQAVDVIRRSPAAALHMAGNYGARGEMMSGKIREAFMSGTHEAFLVVAVIIFVVAVIAALLAPAHADDMA